MDPGSGRLMMFQRRAGQQYKMDLRSQEGGQARGRSMTGSRAADVAQVYLIILQQMLGESSTQSFPVPIAHSHKGKVPGLPYGCWQG